MDKKLLFSIMLGGAVIVIGGTIFYFIKPQDKSESEVIDNDKPIEANSNDDFQRMGEKSFGLAVCEEMLKEEVGQVIGKEVLSVRDYSNGGSSGCEYFVTDQSFVIIDVGFGDMANQRAGLEVLDRTFKTEDRIKLENMLAYTEKRLNDVYMNVSPGKKYVRVGRSSVSVVDEETLVKLAIATEAKIRSYK